MRNLLSVSVPSRHPWMTSSTSPWTNGMSRIPRASTAVQRGAETAPQITACAPAVVRLRAIACGEALVSLISLFAFTCPSTTSTRRKVLAKSRVVATNPCQAAIAVRLILLVLMHKACQATAKWRYSQFITPKHFRTNPVQLRTPLSAFLHSYCRRHIAEMLPSQSGQVMRQIDPPPKFRVLSSCETGSSYGCPIPALSGSCSSCCA